MNNDLTIIPKHELPDFAALEDECKQEVRRFLRTMARILNCNGRGVGRVIAAEAPQFCLSPKRLRTIYDDFRYNGWQALINRRRFPEEDDSLPPAFIEFWRTLCEENKRKTAPAYRELIRGWRTRHIRRRGKKVLLEAIPGYDTWPEEGPKGYPAGWSERNLRRFEPTRFELIAARVGADAAALHRPLVYTGRFGLWVGSHYMLDDMWHNFFVNTLTEVKSGRPLELFSHDLYSGRKVRWGVTVRIRKDDGKYRGLAENMTRMVLAATLFLDGYSPRGTVLVVEHGTAAIPGNTYEKDGEIIREGLDLALWEESGGLITVERSGMEGAPASAGQYPGLSRGNFRFKASLESSNNLTQNEFGAVPAQTGKDVASRPEELSNLLKHNSDLLAAYERLSPERRELLDFPMLELNQFLSLAFEVYGNIESYTDHTLDEWERCGHVVNEFQLDGRWVNQRAVLDLDPAVREIFVAAIESGKVQTRARKMSRREVWDAGAGDLIKLSGFGVVAILGQDLGVERRMRDGKFEFEDAEVGPGKHRFHSLAVDARGELVELAEELYKTFVNPFAPDTLFVCTVKGGYIGQCTRIKQDDVTRADVEAVQRACGAAAKREAELLLPHRKRSQEAAREKLARHQNNARVVGEAPVTAEEKEIKAREPEVRKATANRFSRIAEISRQKNQQEEITG